MTIPHLDSLIIPSQASPKRMVVKSNLAAKEFLEGRVDLLIPSGGKTPMLNPKYPCDASFILEVLIANKVPPESIALETRAQDNMQNLLYSIPLSKGKEIGIVSYPSHLKRFDYIFSLGQKEGVFNPDLHLHKIPTDELAVERMYEIVANYTTKHQLRKYGVSGANIPGGLVKLMANFIMQKLS